jgi:deferrochelatase/peroxidase EfeB
VTLQTDGPEQLNQVAGPAARLPAVPFDGVHQAGITTAPPPAACFVACDVIAADRAELAGLLRAITARARFLTAGGVPPNLGTGAPPSDSGTLGPDVRSARPAAAASHADALLPERRP